MSLSSGAILIVEDDAGWQKMIRNWLVQREFSVLEAPTPDAAKRILAAERIDGLVVDIRLHSDSDETDASGLEFIEFVRLLDPNLPIIVLTGYAAVSSARIAFKQRVFDFIGKGDIDVKEHLLSAIESAIALRSEQFKRIGNPFIPKTGVEPAIFGGRTYELDFFEQKLNNAMRGSYCDHFIILGEWGVGKSTLLREFKKIAQQRGAVSAIVPIEEFTQDSSVADGINSLVQGIGREISVSPSRLEKLMGFFDSVGINILGTGLEVSKDTNQKKLSPKVLLHDSLLKLWEDIREHSPVVVILLDDIQYFAPISPILTTIMQTLSGVAIQNLRILFGLTCIPTKWHEMTSLKKHHPVARYFYSKIELSNLSKTEVYDTIQRSLTNTGVAFDAQIIQRIYEYTNGHPFEMQVLSHNLFDLQILGRVGYEMWEKAIRKSVMDLGGAIFAHWYKGASPNEKLVLGTLASKSSQGMNLSQIQSSLESKGTKMRVRNVSVYLQRLLSKQMIARFERGKYAIPDPMFRTYIELIA